MAAITSGEPPLVMFVSSIMTPELTALRTAIRDQFKRSKILRPWLFEYTPASSADPISAYISKVKECDVFVWISTGTSSEPVRAEVLAALDAKKRILAFRVDETSPDPITVDLVARVGQRAKWSKTSRKEFARVVRISVNDEIIRACRQVSVISVEALVDQAARSSFARADTRSRAAGLDDAVVQSLEDHVAMPKLARHQQPSADRQVVLVSGTVGSGKSSAVEFEFRDELARARTQPHVGVPLWLDARDIVGPLDAELRNHSERENRSDIRTRLLIIDELDSLGSTGRRHLLVSALVMASSDPGLRVLLTARPSADRVDGVSISEIPELDPSDVNKIVDIVSGRRHHLPAFGNAVGDSVRRPLFALLLGLWLKAHEGYPKSRNDLIRSLVETALRAEQVGGDVAFRRLGVTLVTRPHGVAWQEVGSRTDRFALLDSGLVEEVEGGMRFGLPILQEWFAAQAIAHDETSIAAIATDMKSLDRWARPLVIALHEVSASRVDDILKFLLHRDPAYALSIIRETFKDSSQVRNVEVPTDEQAADALRIVVATLADVLGPLRFLLGTTEINGQPVGLRVSTSGGLLAVLTHIGTNGVVPGMPALVDSGPGLLGAHAVKYQWSRNDFAPGWAWRFVTKDFSDELKKWVERDKYSFSPRLLIERAWRDAEILMEIKGRQTESFSIAELRERLSARLAGTRYVGNGGNTDFSALRVALGSLEGEGKKELPRPLPSGDQYPRATGWVWGAFSPERLREYIQAVLEQSLVAYSELMETFKPLTPRLYMNAMMPLKLNATLTIQSDGDNVGLDWYVEPLPRGSRNTVDVKISHAENFAWPDRTTVQQRADSIALLRPEAAEWLSTRFAAEIPDMFGHQPIARTVSKWLATDLKIANII